MHSEGPTIKGALKTNCKSLKSATLKEPLRRGYPEGATQKKPPRKGDPLNQKGPPKRGHTEGASHKGASLFKEVT